MMSCDLVRPKPANRAPGTGFTSRWTLSRHSAAQTAVPVADVLPQVVRRARPAPLLPALLQAPPQELAEACVSGAAFDLPEHRLDALLAHRVVRSSRRRRHL